MKLSPLLFAAALTLVAGAAAAGQISVTLSDEIASAKRSDLTVTVNGVDHTAWSSVQDGVLVISDAPQPFEAENTVRVFLETDTGFEEIGSWIIAHERQDGIRASGTIGGTVGVAATEEGAEVIGGVSGNLTATGRLGAWVLEAEADTGPEFASPNRLDDFSQTTGRLMATRNGEDHQQVIEIGDQKLGRHAMLLPAHDRRGASFRVQTSDQALAIAGFAFANDVPDIDDVQTRGGFSGADLSFRPFGGNLTIRAGAVYGQAAQFVDDPDRRGVNVGGALVWQSDDGNSHAGSELVFSRQTVDGTGTVEDSAVEVWAGHQIHLSGDSGSDSALVSFEAGYRQVGADFFSFGAPDLPAETQRLHLTTGYSSGALALSARVSAESDNIAADAARETNQFADIGIDAAYQLGDGWALNAGGGLAVTRFLDSPFPSEVDSTAFTRFAYAGVSHTSDDLTWSVTPSLSHITGSDLFEQDVLAVQTDVTLAWHPVETVELTAYGQVSAFIDRDLSDATALAFGGQAVWRLTDALELTAALDAAVSDQPGFDGTDARLALAWRADERAVLTAFAGYSGGTLAPSAPFDGSYAGLSLTLEQPFSY